MDERIERLETEVRRLAQNVSELQSRLALLEGKTVAGPVKAAARAQVAQPEQTPSVGWGAGGMSTTGILSLIGRLFIVIGGAYLLRALTEASTISPALGVSLGLAYALLWLAAADRAAGKGLLWSSVFHGIAAALTAFPLLWEAATRFHIIQPPWDIGLLAALTAIWLMSACRRRFQALAWLATLGALATAVALAISTGDLVSGSLFLVVLGVVTLWLGYELEWRGLRWPVALAADLLVLGLTLQTLPPQPKGSPAAALTVQLTLLGLYLANIAFRTVVRARKFVPFEVVQVIAAFLVGFVGAVSITRSTGFGTSVLGAAGLLLGAASYGVAFVFVDRQKGHGRNFYFYTSMALLFLLTGSNLLLEATPLSLAWVFLAVSIHWLGWRFVSLALALQATICLGAAGVSSGLFAYAATALAGPASLVGSFPAVAHVLVLAGAGFCIGLPVHTHTESARLWHRINRVVITLILLGGMGGIADSVSGHLWGGLAAGGVEPGVLATVRTVVLTLSAVVLAYAGRHDRFLEWGWLVYPVLAATGLKILLEDLSRSRPATLFLALAVYGCGLIISPRLRRAREPPPPSLDNP
ncbi:MAG: hypothetical protein AB1486_18095 [Planctomycetota bacterium]